MTSACGAGATATAGATSACDGATLRLPTSNVGRFADAIKIARHLSVPSVTIQ
jgi:hypothetical protein